MILGLVYGYIPYMILPLFGSLDAIDRSLLEGARDLGARPREVFRRVTWPLSRPAVVAGVLIVALPITGDYYTADLLSGSPRTTMLANQIDFLLHARNAGSDGRRGPGLPAGGGADPADALVPAARGRGRRRARRGAGMSAKAAAR